MYGSLEGVSGLVPSVGAFTATSTPSEAQVDTWLEEATVLVNGALAAAGYSTTVVITAAIMPALVAMAQLYAAATVLQARGLDSSSGGDENKSEQMFRRFYAQLAWLGNGHLEELGVLLLVTAPRRRRIRTVQTRRIDGYSATYEGSAIEYEYPSE